VSLIDLRNINKERSMFGKEYSDKNSGRVSAPVYTRELYIKKEKQHKNMNMTAPKFLKQKTVQIGKDFTIGK